MHQIPDRNTLAPGSVPVAPQPGGLLALDLSSTVGWCLGGPADRVPHFGVWRLPAAAVRAPRLAAFQVQLAAAIVQLRPRAIVMEAPLPAKAERNADTARQQLGLAALVECEGWLAHVPVTETPAATARAAVLQRGWQVGNVKQHVLAWCRMQGWQVPDHNAGDACVLWWHAIANEQLAARIAR